MANNKNQEPVSFGELELVKKLLLGSIEDAVESLHKENDVLRLILIGLVIVLFIGYVALLISVIGLLFTFFK